MSFAFKKIIPQRSAPHKSTVESYFRRLSTPDSRRLGMALPLVIALLSLLAIIAFYLFWFSSRQREQSHRLSSSEVAIRAAEFTAQQSFHLIQRSVDFINSSLKETFVGNTSQKDYSSVPEALQEFLNTFTSDGKIIRDRSVKLQLNNLYANSKLHPLIGEMTVLNSYPDMTLEVDITHENFENPYYKELALPGLQPQNGLEGEGCGRFIIDVKAKYSDVSRRVIMVVNERSVQMTWPVIGRFVLYADKIVSSNHSTTDVNQIVYELSGSGDPKIIESYKLADSSFKPLVVLGGESVTENLHEHFTKNPGDAAEFLNKQGWILLGGQEEITLGLAPGTNDYGEHFLLANNMVFLRDIVRDIPPFGFSYSNPSLGGQFELWNDCEIYSILTGLYKESRANTRKHLFAEAPEYAFLHKSSLLRLMGTNTQQSPTLIFGNVFRRYILEQGLRKKTFSLPTPDSNASPFPYLSEAGYNSPQWAGGMISNSAVEVLKGTNNNSWTNYRKVMSHSLKTAVNEGLVFWLTPSIPPGAFEDNMPILSGLESETIAKIGKPIFFSPPGTPQSLVLSIDGNSLYRDGTRIFDGNFGVLPNIRNIALSRCGRTFETGDDLYVYLKSNFSKKGSNVGYYYVKQPFTWTNEWNSYALGGCGIVCGGSITIQEMVKPYKSADFPDADENLITFVALTGNIKVNTENIVEASLLAPSGKLELSQGGGCNINGLVAVQTLDVESFANTRTKTVSYDARHDWADKDSFRKGHRIMLEQQPIIFSAKLN